MPNPQESTQGAGFSYPGERALSQVTASKRLPDTNETCCSQNRKLFIKNPGYRRNDTDISQLSWNFSQRIQNRCELLPGNL